MDELELLKKDWNKGTDEYKNYSDSDIIQCCIKNHHLL